MLFKKSNALGASSNFYCNQQFETLSCSIPSIASTKSKVIWGWYLTIAQLALKLVETSRALVS